MSSSLRKIASHYLLTPQGLISRPLVTVDAATRRILAIEQYGDDLDLTAGVEFHAGVLSPGFVNAHTHLELSHLCGAIEPGCGFAAFGQAVGRLRDATDEAGRIDAACRADAAMWDEGVEAAADIMNDDTSFAAKERSRIRYRSFLEVFGLRRSNLTEQRARLSHPGTSLTPHSTYSVTDADFRAVCAEGDAPLSIHFMETEDERTLYFGGGALHEWYARAGFGCDFLKYGMPSERIVECVPKGRSVMLVHNCHIMPIDFDIIMTHFTAPVYWVLAPRSNRYISGTGPRTVGLLRSCGAKICIGTDSLASNTSLSIMDELKCFPDIGLEELLTWATRNGAEALGMADEIGTAEVGKRCGLVLVTGVDYSTMRLTPQAAARRII